MRMLVKGGEKSRKGRKRKQKVAARSTWTVAGNLGSTSGLLPAQAAATADSENKNSAIENTHVD
jgi:hypothetical protein